METCRCEYNDSLAKKFDKVWSPGTLYPWTKLQKVPENAILKWKKNFEDPLSKYAEIYEIHKPSICSATTTPHICLLTKWIPLEPGLIAQKYVNQCRTLKSSPLY